MTWGIPHVMRTTTSARAASAHPRRPARSRHWASSACIGTTPEPTKDRITASKPISRSSARSASSARTSSSAWYATRPAKAAGTPPSASCAASTKSSAANPSFSRTKVLFPECAPPTTRIIGAYQHGKHRELGPLQKPSGQIPRHPAEAGQGNMTVPRERQKPRHRHKGADGPSARDHPCSRSRSESAKRHDDRRALLSRRESRGHAVRPRGRPAFYGEPRKRAGEPPP